MQPLSCEPWTPRERADLATQKSQKTQGSGSVEGPEKERPREVLAGSPEGVAS